MAHPRNRYPSSRRSLGGAALLLLLALPAWAGEELPVRIIAEAEEFTVEGDGDGDGWEVLPYGRNYFASTFAISFLSRQACLSAPRTTDAESRATQVVRIPADGEYRLFARYEQPYDHAVEFGVEVVQGGKVLLRGTLGRRESPKYWPFSKGETAPMKWWFWGGGDNIVWEHAGAVKLRRGTATLRLVAGPQGDGDPRIARRNVDVLCLTNDLEGIERHRRSVADYLPFDGWLVQAGDLYVRVTNPKDGLGPCVPVIRPFKPGQMSPYWVHTRDWGETKLVRGGRVDSAAACEYRGPHAGGVRPDLLAPVLRDVDFERPPEDLFLRPGDRSGWVPLGHMLDALHVSRWAPHAQYPKGKRRTKIDLEIEFAVPDGEGGLTRIHGARVRGQPGYPVSPLTFEISGNVRAERSISTQAEALERVAAELGPAASAPRRFPIRGLMGFSPVVLDEGPIGEAATRLALALGDNTMTWSTHAHAKALGVPRRRTALSQGHWPTDLAALEKKCDALEKTGTLDQLGLVSYGDEKYVDPAKISDAELAEWLEERDISVRGPVKVAKDPSEPLYYYSRLCEHEKGFEQWAAATRYILERTEGGALAGVNYGPAPHNAVDELNFVRAFRRKALSVAWSEDYVWQMPELSVQVTGYRVSGLRAGAKYHGNPILMYVMPHSPGNTSRSMRLSYYAAVAHGATMAHFYCATPSVVGTSENYIVTHDIERFRAVRNLVDETAAFEDYVLDGKVRPARVALLLSSVDDIRNPGELASGGFTNLGRKAIYYALRHAQVPVDFLTEDDVIEGRGDDYSLIYVTQEYLHSRALTALRRWVERGGTLVALCGGGFVDELNRPNPSAAALYGVARQSLKKDGRLAVFHVKQDLPYYEPLDRVSWRRPGGGWLGRKTGDVPVILWQQVLKAGKGDVLGKYRNGGAAVVSREHGKGRAVLFGFMAGLSYLRSGLERRPWDRGASDDAAAHYLPTGFDAALREALVDDFLPEDFRRPVVCDAPLVEATCIDTEEPARTAVPLMNFSGRRIDELRVEVRGLGRVKRVRSVVHGEISPTVSGGTLEVTLPLDVTDMLLIDRE